MRNKLDGKPLGDGVLLAAGIGGAFGALGAPGVGKFMGKVASRTGSGLSKVAGKVFSRGGKVCALSFSSDTAVTTPDGGQQAIATLEEGDAIVAYDPETGEASTQTVEHVWINHDDDLIDLTLRPDAQGQAQAGDGTRKQQDAAVASHGMRAPPQNVQAKTPIAADTGNETVHTTAKHPGQSRGERGWVQAGALQVGQRVVRLDGSTATITSVRVVPGAATMYNLTVSHLHTFVVGAGQYVVHNVCLQPYKVGSVKDGHHIYAKAAFRGLAKYDEDAALVIKNADMAANGWTHMGVNSITAAQQRMFTQLAKSGAPNTLRAHTRIAWQSLVAGGVPRAQARSMTAQALRQLRNWGIRSPTRIPWN